MILKLVVELGKIARKDVEKELGISQTAAIRLVKILVQSGALYVSGAGRNTRYTIKK